MPSCVTPPSADPELSSFRPNIDKNPLTRLFIMQVSTAGWKEKAFSISCPPSTVRMNDPSGLGNYRTFIHLFTKAIKWLNEVNLNKLHLAKSLDQSFILVFFFFKLELGNKVNSFWVVEIERMKFGRYKATLKREKFTQENKKPTHFRTVSI